MHSPPTHTQNILYKFLRVSPRHQSRQACANDLARSPPRVISRPAGDRSAGLPAAHHCSRKRPCLKQIPFDARIFRMVALWRHEGRASHPVPPYAMQAKAGLHLERMFMERMEARRAS